MKISELPEWQNNLGKNLTGLLGGEASGVVDDWNLITECM